MVLFGRFKAAGSKGHHPPVSAAASEAESVISQRLITQKPSIFPLFSDTGPDFMSWPQWQATAACAWLVALIFLGVFEMVLNSQWHVDVGTPRFRRSGHCVGFVERKNKTTLLLERGREKVVRLKIYAEKESFYRGKDHDGKCVFLSWTCGLRWGPWPRTMELLLYSNVLRVEANGWKITKTHDGFSSVIDWIGLFKLRRFHLISPPSASFLSQLRRREDCLTQSLMCRDEACHNNKFFWTINCLRK